MHFLASASNTSSGRKLSQRQGHATTSHAQYGSSRFLWFVVVECNGRTGLEDPGIPFPSSQRIQIQGYTRGFETEDSAHAPVDPQIAGIAGTRPDVTRSTLQEKAGAPTSCSTTFRIAPG